MGGQQDWCKPSLVACHCICGLLWVRLANKFLSLLLKTFSCREPIFGELHHQSSTKIPKFRQIRSKCASQAEVWWSVSLTLHPEYFTPQPHPNHIATTQLYHTGNRSDRRDKMKILARDFLARLWRTEILRQTFIHWRIYAVPGITLKPCILMWSISVFTARAMIARSWES